MEKLKFTLSFMLFGVILAMPGISSAVPNVFETGDPILASEMNENFVELETQINTISLTPGPAGPQGPVGATGSQGQDGADGATGSQGLAGATGQQGVQGIQGNDGADGAAGDTGATGLQGLVGTTGSQGIQGIPGNDGVDGATGAAGAIGPAGPEGPAGVTPAEITALEAALAANDGRITTLETAGPDFSGYGMGFSGVGAPKNVTVMAATK